MTWRERYLESIGAMIEGATACARGRRCKACGAYTIRGLTQPPFSAVAEADPSPLSNLGELQAIAAGLVTFDLARRAGRLQLEDRDPMHIEGSPPDSPDLWRKYGDVLAQHRCNNPVFDSRPSRVVMYSKGSK